MIDDQSSSADNPTPSPVEAPAAEEHHHSHTATFHAIRPPVCLSSILWVLFFLALTAATRCANFRNVFVTNGKGTIEEVYFIDGDCY